MLTWNNKTWVNYNHNKTFPPQSFLRSIELHHFNSELKSILETIARTSVSENSSQTQWSTSLNSVLSLATNALQMYTHFIRRTTNTQSRCSLSGNGHDLTLRYRSRRATLRLLFGTGLNKEGKSIDKVLISVTSRHWYGVLEQCNFYRKQLFQVAGPKTIADILSDGMWRPALPIAQCTVCTCKWYLLSLYSASRYSSTFLESKGKKEILTSFENASKSIFWVIWNKISQEITKYWSHCVIRIDSRYQFVFDLIEDKPKWCNFFKSHSNCH